MFPTNVLHCCSVKVFVVLLHTSAVGKTVVFVVVVLVVM